MPAIPVGSRLLAAVGDSAREHAPITAFVAVYVVGAWLMALLVGVPFRIGTNLGTYALFVAVPLAIGFAWHFVSVVLIVRPDRPIQHLARSLRSYLAPERMLFALPVLVLIPTFAATFTFVKSSIPALVAYDWDPAFTRWDAWLHGGRHPWELLHPLLGHPRVTSVLGVAYQLWLLLMYLIVVLVAFDTRRRALRMRFLISYFLTWVVLGTFGAIAFASMGPCYDPALARNEGPYAPLVQYLQETHKATPLRVIDSQKRLWADFSQNRVGIGSGISAMPSLHVGACVLFALFGWRYSRTAGIALAAFALAIFLGSIHLGWHYAIDGYAGGVGATAIWWIVGRWQARVGRNSDAETPGTAATASWRRAERA